MNVLDTNVWIYLHDSRFPAKQAVAERFARNVRPLALPWQVGCEFLSASRKLIPIGFSTADAWDALRDMRKFTECVLIPNDSTWDIAKDVFHKHGLSYWDALLLAICMQHKIQQLYSEDFGAPRVLEGIDILNPFKDL